MGDAFCIGNLGFFERNEGFRRIAKRDILLSFECRYAALAVRKEEVYSRRRSDGCTVRPSLRRRDSSGHCERLSMGDAFSIDDLRFFERNEDFTIVWKHLPHWTQAATLTFITWRLADSLPAAVISEWQLERDALLRDLGIDPDSDWKLALKKLPPDRRGRIQWSLFFAWDCRLDEAAGSCLLKTPEFSKIVLDSLLHFEGDRTVLTDAIIMPNHVHLIAAFRSQESMFEQCTSWKHFTATKIRRIQRSRLPTQRQVYRTPVAPPTGELSGQFWQTDQFDHLVRSEEQFQFLRDYIRKNPVRAGLGAGEYLHYSRAM
jgi:type I restriction enzyme R subunit